MNRYLITNTASGVDLGVYEGETGQEAIEAMARDAGYDSAADMPGASNLIATIVAD